MNIREIQRCLLDAKSEEELDDVINDIELCQMVDLVKMFVYKLNAIRTISAIEDIDCIE